MTPKFEQEEKQDLTRIFRVENHAATFRCKF